jgi:hypothetical protein
MKEATLTLIDRDPKGTPRGDMVINMKFLKTLPDPLVSLFSFTFASPGGQPREFNLTRNVADSFFQLLANIVVPFPVSPGGSAIRFQTADCNGNPNGTIEIKITLYIYVDTSENINTYLCCSLLLDSPPEVGFILDRLDANAFYYNFDSLMSTNPPDPA